MAVTIEKNKEKKNRWESVRVRCSGDTVSLGLTSRGSVFAHILDKLMGKRRGGSERCCANKSLRSLLLLSQNSHHWGSPNSSRASPAIRRRPPPSNRQPWARVCEVRTCPDRLYKTQKAKTQQWAGLFRWQQLFSSPTDLAMSNPIHTTPAVV